MSRSPFGGLRPPRPPAELRRRVLAACAAAAAAGERDGLLDRLWVSRRVRWAWLALVVLLAAGNLAVSPAPAVGERDLPVAAVEGEMSWLASDLPRWWRRPSPVITWADIGPAYGDPVGAGE